VRDHCTTQVQVGSRRDWHCVWYVAALVLHFAGVKFRGLLITGEHLGLSAFLVVVWCTYRNKSSTLIRAIAANATIYFFTMVAAQVYIQLAYSLLEVRSPARFSHPFAKYNRYRVSPNKCRSCEYAIKLNDNRSELTGFHPARLKCIWIVRLASCRSVVTSSYILTSFAQHQFHIDHEVRGLVETVRGSGRRPRVAVVAFQYRRLC